MKSLQQRRAPRGGTGSHPLDVLFAVLPFADVGTPAMAPGLLQAEIVQAGFSSRIRHFNLDFAARIGAARYRQVFETYSPRTLAGERIFAEVLFGKLIPSAKEYAARMAEEYPGHGAKIRALLETRHLAGEFIEDCASEILRLRPRVVAFTTTFQQTCAALALAARIKRFGDSYVPVVMFGGANCEGEMGLQFLQSFPWVDYVCTGEGDVVFPQFLERLLREGNPAPLPGLLRQGESHELSVPPQVRDMDQLPVPDFTDYFEQLKLRRTTSDMNHVALLMQTSRGCWWGAKQHCTFCGLNDETMAFRSKSPERAFQELRFLVDYYGARNVYSVDNILDVRYLKTLFPRLIELGAPVNLFFETKANLTFEQLATMRAAGVKWIQPGIESFSTEVLRLMQKGTTRLKNIQLLRWCHELGIEPLWNILCGFPGEASSDYTQMAKLVPLLIHLDPPQACGTIRLDRFSPYFSRAEEYGVRNVRANDYYRHVFPLPASELNRLAYYSECEWPTSVPSGEYSARLKRAVRRWQALARRPRRERPRLDFRQTTEGVTIVDTRPCARRRVHRLRGIAAEVYLLCERGRTMQGLLSELGGSLTDIQLRKVLRKLEANRLLIEDDAQYLSLAVWRNRPKSILPESIIATAVSQSS